nr:hypothetical protein BaRGS_026593 [Batillaria attramentaria]
MAPKRHVEKQSKVHIPETLALEAENEEKFKSDVEEIRKKPTGDNKRGVIYLGHIPHGFFEPQMKEFFSQFGQVTRIKLSRSKKTGRAKGYAFIEFKHEEVAKVVADTMNNYLMFIRLLKCEFIPEERLHPETFKGWNRRFSAPKSHRLAAERHNSIKSAAKQKTIDGRRQRKLKKTMQKLSDLGVEYSLEQAEVWGGILGKS